MYFSRSPDSICIILADTSYLWFNVSHVLPHGKVFWLRGFDFSRIWLRGFVLMLSHFDPDHAADRPGGGEQSANQHGWRCHISEIPPRLLCAQPAFPSRAGGLDSRLQPWSEGMQPFLSWNLGFMICNLVSYQRTQGCQHALHQCCVSS